MEGEEEYWAERSKLLPRPLFITCAAILILGLVGSLVLAVVPFGSQSSADAMAIDDSSGESSASAPSEAQASATPADEDADADLNLASVEASINAADAAVGNVADAASANSGQPVVAYISCRVQSMTIDASRCIAPSSSDDPGGYLKISGAGSVKRYGPTEVLGTLSGSRARVPLAGDYSIEAQANGDSDYTLRLEVYRGSQLVYQNEGSDFDTLSASAAAE